MQFLKATLILTLSPLGISEEGHASMEAFISPLTSPPGCFLSPC